VSCLIRLIHKTTKLTVFAGVYSVYSISLRHRFLGQRLALLLSGPRYLISINDCMMTQFGDGTRGHRSRGDRTLEGILYRFEI
jgi:hypothetical protein